MFGFGSLGAAWVGMTDSSRARLFTGSPPAPSVAMCCIITGIYFVSLIGGICLCDVISIPNLDLKSRINNTEIQDYLASYLFYRNEDVVRV
jgi:hypothetical protein